MSDRTWCRLGRRRPYFLIGAVLATVALFLMPNSSELWMAAGLLWVLDASLNISMVPFRAFIADLLPENQVSDGYAWQTILIGIGGAIGFWVASFDWLGFFPSLSAFAPSSVHIQFYLCGLLFLIGIIWTVVSTKETPPSNLEEFRKKTNEKKGVLGFLKELYICTIEMPKPMRWLAVVQFCTWLGLFCMWMYYSVAVAHHIFGAAGDTTSAAYEQGIQVASSTMSIYQIVSMAFAFMIPFLVRKIGAVSVHTIGLVAAGLGLASIWFITNPQLLYLSMFGVGLGWASTLCMPFVILVKYIPQERYGIYMGIFNFFIVIPEILSALFFGWVMKNLFHNQHIYAVVMGGVFMIIAGIVVQFVRKYEKKV